MPQPLDGKAYGILYTTKDNQVIPPDEYIVFRVHDVLLLDTLKFYERACRHYGCEASQVNAVKDLIGRVEDWQEKHPERMKTPDVEPGELPYGI